MHTQEWGWIFKIYLENGGAEKNWKKAGRQDGLYTDNIAKVL